MKLRRKQPDQTTGSADGLETDRGGDPAAAPIPGSENLGRANGPWDAAEVDSDEDGGQGDPTKVDLGGLVVTGGPGLELRLQVDEASSSVMAALLVSKEGAVELRPFAAPRNADIWEDIRTQIADETVRRGGTVNEIDGTYGKELQVVVPVATPDGQAATQPSRVLGIRGPRWLLRATYLGKPAMQPDPDDPIEAAVRRVVVVRGTDPMPPGEPLALVMPPNAKPVRAEDPSA